MKKKVGRPKGSSTQAAREHYSLKEALVNDIAMEWQEKVKTSNGFRMKKKRTFYTH
jgi:hypothetical protein